MKLKINGLDALIGDLEEITNTGLISEEALVNAGEKLKKEIRKDTPKRSGKAKDCLTVNPKIDKKTLKVVKVGFDDQFTKWEDWKGVYFNHYGFNLKMFGVSTNIYVDKHKGWFDKALKKNKTKLETELMKELENNIGKLL